MGQPQKREWTVDLRARDEGGELYWDEDFAQQQTIQAAIECATIQHREGGTFIIAPLRTQMAPPADSLAQGPVWANIGLVISHTFAPPVKQRPVNGNGNPAGNPVASRPQLAEDVAPGLDPDDDLVYEDDEDLEGADEPTAQPFGMAPDPMPEPPLVDVDAEQSRLSPADLLPKVQ